MAVLPWRKNAVSRGLSSRNITRHRTSALHYSLVSTSVVSAGTLPNFAPTPQPDGTCATYTIQPNDDCSSIAATWSITVAEINSYNTDTWGWSGCTLIYADAIICLSTGNPPMPAVVANAVCGPQVPGTATPPAGTDLSQLNPCPLNACCDIWGQVSSSFPSVNSRCVTLLTQRRRLGRRPLCRGPPNRELDFLEL